MSCAGYSNTDGGGFNIAARTTDATNGILLQGRGNGYLGWNGKNIVRSVGGYDADINGNVFLSRINCSGNDYNNNIDITLRTFSGGAFINADRWANDGS